MLKTNWKSTALMAGISVVSVLLLLSALITTINLALFTNVGITSWLFLLLLTIASSRLSVRVTSTDGVLSSRESIADSFVLLAVMLYAVPPSNSAGPAVAARRTRRFRFQLPSRYSSRSHAQDRHGVVSVRLNFCRRFFLRRARRICLQVKANCRHRARCR